MGWRTNLLFWLVAYELASLTFTVISSLVILNQGTAPRIESISFIERQDPLRAVLRIWWTNAPSFFLGGTLVALSPFLGLFAVAYLSVSTGTLLASWMANKCPTTHFLYGIVETQAYLMLWLLIVKTRLELKRCKDSRCKRERSIKYLKRIVIITAVTFLVLAIAEVTEVRFFASAEALPASRKGNPP